MIKIDVPLTASELFNLMKGGIYEWDEVPHVKDKKVRIDLRIHGVEGEDNLFRELFEEHPTDDTYKHGDAK
jgi:hypothetical protein|tara:strand:+ start:324 stop:536 length:213 start_codon:yes stop_codon:yes gene_type:complete